MQRLIGKICSGPARRLPDNHTQKRNSLLSWNNNNLTQRDRLVTMTKFEVILFILSELLWKSRHTNLTKQTYMSPTLDPQETRKPSQVLWSSIFSTRTCKPWHLDWSAVNALTDRTAETKRRHAVYVQWRCKYTHRRVMLTRKRVMQTHRRVM